MSSDKAVRFARWVFLMAGIVGLIEVVPLYFLENMIGRTQPPPITHPGFYYGFVGVALVWQVAFALIARDPVRLRPMMILAVLEKFSFGAVSIVLYLQQRMHGSDLVLSGADMVLGVLFIVAYLRTPAP